jgi:phage I-like protein
MNDFKTRTGGESETQAGNLVPSFVIDTAGAPAHTILSRDAGGPEWIELLPAGTFYGRDGRGPFRIEDAANLIAATAALGMSAGLPIDYDHATDFGAPEGRPAPAAGWIRELDARAGALWGRVEWTARARESIAGHEYRYVSPVFQYDPKTGAVTRLLRAGLTNNPNLHLTAIAAAEIAAPDEKESNMEFFSKELLAVLELGADASAEDALAKVRALRASGAGNTAGMASGNADPAHYVAVAEFERTLTELHALRAERAQERASHRVEEQIRAGKISPAQREWAIAYCAADTAAFDAFIAKQPSILGGGELPRSREPGSEVRANALSAAEIGICAQLGLKHSDFRKRKSGGIDFLSLGHESDNSGDVRIVNSTLTSNINSQNTLRANNRINSDRNN